MSKNIIVSSIIAMIIGCLMLCVCTLVNEYREREDAYNRVAILWNGVVASCNEGNNCASGDKAIEMMLKGKNNNTFVGRSSRLPAAEHGGWKGRRRSQKDIQINTK